MASFRTFDGERIAYHVVGAGAPVILVHGYTGRGAHWAQLGVVGALRASHRSVITLDLRGHGDSASPHDPMAYKDGAMARDVMALADACGLDGYDLVGYSLGSIVAGAVVQRDDRVRSLTLAGLGDSVFDPTWTRPPLLAAALTGDRNALAAEPTAGMIIDIIVSGGGDRVALAGVQHGHVALEREALATLRVPVLVLCGTDDRTNGDPGLLANAIPDARLVEIAGDHFSAFGTAAFTAAIVQFLGEVSPTTNNNLATKKLE